MKKSILVESEAVINSLTDCWPLGVQQNNKSVAIELGHDRREIWAFPLVGGNSDMDSTIYSMEERRKVIPAALQRCATEINGALLVGYYAKKIADDNYEHGLVIVPAVRKNKAENAELLTSYCYEREKLYDEMLQSDYFKQIQLFLDNYKAICKKYWIQDTRIINTEFVKRPLIDPEDKWEHFAATSTWHTEVYPDFMRPVKMIGDVYFDFMLCDHKLVYLQNEFEEDDTVWDFFEEEAINELISMPSEFVNSSLETRINGWFKTTDFEISNRKDLNYVTQYDISVPDLVGGIIDEGYTIGWCGKYAFMGVSLDKPLYITPDLLHEISEVADFEQAGFDNKAYWRNRDIEYRKRCGTHNLVKVCDDLMTEKQAKFYAVEKAKIALQWCKDPLKDVQKGINKFLARYLKGLARGTEEKKATELLNAINSAQICADEQEALLKIIDWASH